MIHREEQLRIWASGKDLVDEICCGNLIHFIHICDNIEKDDDEDEPITPPIDNPSGDTPSDSGETENPPIVDPDEPSNPSGDTPSDSGETENPPIEEDTCSTKYWVGNDEYTVKIEGVLNKGTIPSSVTKVEIGDCVTSLGNFAFDTYTNLSSVTIPNSVTSIGSYVFDSCSFSSITIPNSVTSIGKGAFERCSRLTSIVIPNNITTLGNNTFNRCSSLTSVTIPDSVTSIGNNVFYNVPIEGDLICSDEWYNNLTPTQITNLGNVYHWRKKPITPPTDEPTEFCGLTIKSVFYGEEKYDLKISVPQYWCESCREESPYYNHNITDIVIGDCIEWIDESAFENQPYLTSVTLNSNIRLIYGGAFYGASKLEELDLSMTKINRLYNIVGESTKLKTIKLPNTLVAIQTYFPKCYELENIIYNGTVEQWNQIFIDGGEPIHKFCEDTKVTKITCTDGFVNI